MDKKGRLDFILSLLSSFWTLLYLFELIQLLAGYVDFFFFFNGIFLESNLMLWANTHIILKIYEEQKYFLRLKQGN